MPVGDRDDFGPRPTGVAAARAALGTSRPAPEFAESVCEVAQRHGWRVHRCEGARPGSHPGWPTLVLVREEQVIAAHVGSREPTFSQDDWLSRLNRVEGVVKAVWLAKDGLAPVEDALSRRSADGVTVHPGWGGPPWGESDHGTRGD